MTLCFGQNENQAGCVQNFSESGHLRLGRFPPRPLPVLQFWTDQYPNVLLTPRFAPATAWRKYYCRLQAPRGGPALLARLCPAQKSGRRYAR